MIFWGFWGFGEVWVLGALGAGCLGGVILGGVVCEVLHFGVALCLPVLLCNFEDLVFRFVLGCRLVGVGFCGLCCSLMVLLGWCLLCC